MSKKRLVQHPQKAADLDMLSDYDDTAKDWKHRAKRLHERRWRLFEKNEQRTATSKRVRFAKIKQMFH